MALLPTTYALAAAILAGLAVLALLSRGGRPAEGWPLALLAAGVAGSAVGGAVLLTALFVQDGVFLQGVTALGALGYLAVGARVAAKLFADGKRADGGLLKAVGYAFVGMFGWPLVLLGLLRALGDEDG